MDPVQAALASLPITGPVLVLFTVAIVAQWRQNNALQNQRADDAKQYAAQLLQMSKDTVGALGGVSNALGGVKEAQSEIKTLLKDVDEGVEDIRRPPARR